MANKMVANIKSLTTGVDDLTKKVDNLYASLSKVNSVAKDSLQSAGSVLGMGGGQYGLGQSRTRPGTGADGASFPRMAYGQIAQGENILKSSLAGFSNSPFASSMVASAAGDAMSGVGKIVSGTLGMIPGLSATMNRTYGYYQAGLRAPGINRGQLERATLGSMGGGISGVGSDAQVAMILASMGYTPGSRNYLQAAGQVGGAYNYLGMNNAAAAQAIGGFQTGPMGANLFQYGITTFNASTGREKTTGQLARELMGYMTGGAKVTAQDVRSSYQKGALGANLSNMGFSADQQSMLYQAMIDIASGGTGELGGAKPRRGNENTFLTAQGRINQATTQTMQEAEQAMIRGFENAADAVEAFNRVLRNVTDPLGYTVGLTSGIGGSQAGQGVTKVASGAMDVLKSIGKAITAFFTRGAVGGGSTGYGSSFGVANRGRIGGSSPAPGAGVIAGYGAKDGSGIWSGTNGTHTGVDYEMPVGTPVKSAYDGTVSQVNINADYGTSIMVDNINGTQAIYGHLSEKSVKVGDQVKSGQTIGKSGQSGNANGPHLHFEIRDAKNHPVDPNNYLSGSGFTASLFQNYAKTIPTRYDIAGASTSSSTSSNLTTGNYSPSKGALSDAALRDVLFAAGFRGSSIDTAMRVVRAESGGRPGALNPNASTGDYSMGLFQINMIGDLGTARNAKYLKEYGQYGYTGPESLYEPGINARIAYDISKGGTKWTDAWVNTSKKLGIGGASTGYGAAVNSSTAASGNRTVNVTLKLDRVSEQEAMHFAKKVKYYLEHDDETTLIGRA